VDYLTRGIPTREPGTIDGRFFFQLGDALTRLGRHDEAGKVTALNFDIGQSHICDTLGYLCSNPTHMSPDVKRKTKNVVMLGTAMLLLQVKD